MSFTRRQNGNIVGLLSLLAFFFTGVTVSAKNGVFVRFKLEEPARATYFVRLAGHIHNSPWSLRRAVIPAGADKDNHTRVAAGHFTPWFDLGKHAGDQLHGRLNRAGGVAEFPNVTADFVVDPPSEHCRVVIELATSEQPEQIVKQWRESIAGTLTSFLVSPDLIGDANELESAAEMTARRLRWARSATGGRRASPKQLIVQTSFWGPQRAELNLQEAEVLHLLGFNVVGNQRPEVREAFDLRLPGHTHNVAFGPSSTREQIDTLMKTQAARQQQAIADDVPFGFADEVVCRPPIGNNPIALSHFHQWLADVGVSPEQLGESQYADIVPIETPEILRSREKQDCPAARRVFYYTSRFRQHAATQRLRWHTEAFHKYFPGGARTSTLVADHPYFAGSGLGMGMTLNPAWGNYPLACDWFQLGRERAVDLIGIEDWMGLQYMYGPNWTFEGFQLMGFQAAMFRSASQGELPTIAWITPSDETNLRLKTASALCQGAKHFFYWTYGPTATSTENYWSDLRGAYDGIASVTRQLAAAEHLLASGRTRPTRVALLYSVSSDLWQPFGYVHMLERRGLYLSLVHDQYLVDFLSEEDVVAGRLDKYDVLYTADPCIRTDAARKIANWVRSGGSILATTAAGTRNEFNEPMEELTSVFGITQNPQVDVQAGRYHLRGALNDMEWLDQMDVSAASLLQADSDAAASTVDQCASEDPILIGAIGVKVHIEPTTARVTAAFSDGSPAVVRHEFGKGNTLVVASCPAIAYLKEARFVAEELREKWPVGNRCFLNMTAARRGAPRLVELSHPVVECGVYDAPGGTALVLANFTYEPIEQLQVRLPLPRRARRIRSLEQGGLPFVVEPSNGQGEYPFSASFTVSLGLNDLILVE